MKAAVPDYDSPWKMALVRFWRPFLQLCFPHVAADIDWLRPCEFLDKELQAVTRESATGRRQVDALVKVFRLDGAEHWVLVHVEVQSRPDPKFAARMQRYHQRLVEYHDRPVASLAVLADPNPTWRPCGYEMSLWGCRLRFEFPVCKLLDLSDEVVERELNPVSFVIAAQRVTQRYRHRPEDRKGAKLGLMRRLYRRGYQAQDVRELIHLIDWMILLPAELAQQYHQELTAIEKENQMAYITSYERVGIRKGRLETLREAVKEALEVRFGEVPLEAVKLVESAPDPNELRRWLRLAITLPSTSAFLEAIQKIES